MSYAIETIDLTKAFSSTCAVDGLNIQVGRGRVFGLLGPNGSGKTTTVRLLTTLLSPTSGQAQILGLDVVRNAAQVRQKISVTGQFASLDEDLTGLENLVLFSRLLGFSWRDARSRAEQLIACFDLVEAAKRQVLTYSGGMRRRLDIAASLIVTPEILCLDEPTTGLDPRSRNQVWDIVRSISDQGTTVLLTTQYLEEADQLADHLAVIDKGKLIAQGTSRELKAKVGGGSLQIYLHDPQQNFAAQECLSRILGDAVSESADHSLVLQVSKNDEALDALNLLKLNHFEVAEFSLGAPSLDEVFFALTGKATAEIDKDQL